MERRFTRHGIAPDRLTLVPGTDREGIKRLYATVDVSLDTWPYCGGNTIAESLMMGVPVVTLLGETFAARYGASLLAASGCGDLIATSVDGYVATASALATDTDCLSRLRRTLREDMRIHGFSDSARFAATLETAYIAMMDAHRARAGR
jgi:predicted O-linked N-acetylglucosamine transferase (SPINDLY family)